MAPLAADQQENIWFGFYKGFYAAGSNVWGLGMFLQMLSYAALAQELGWNLYAILMSTYLVWGLPGQLAMVDLTAAGAPLLTIAIAVSMANARMAAMSVAILPILPKQNFFARLLTVQVIGITVFLYSREHLANMSMHNRRARFWGFSGFMLVGAGLGNVIGYYVPTIVPDLMLRMIIFLGPVFLLLIISAAKQVKNRITALLGVVLCLLLTPFIGSVAVIIAGIVGGSLGYYFSRKNQLAN